MSWGHVSAVHKALEPIREKDEKTGTMRIVPGRYADPRMNGITAAQIAVLNVMAHAADHTGRCYPGIEYLAARTGLSDRAVRNALADLGKGRHNKAGELVDEKPGKNLIELKQPGIGRGHASVFEIVIQPDAKPARRAALHDGKPAPRAALSDGKPARTDDKTGTDGPEYRHDVPPNLLGISKDESGGDAPADGADGRATDPPNDWEPNDGHRQQIEAYPHIDLSAEVRKFLKWYADRGVPPTDAHFTKWLNGTIKPRRPTSDRPANAGTERNTDVERTVQHERDSEAWSGRMDAHSADPANATVMTTLRARAESSVQVEFGRGNVVDGKLRELVGERLGDRRPELADYPIEQPTANGNGSNRGGDDG
jgi:hypothetical protein